MKKITIGVCDDYDAALHDLEHLIFEIDNIITELAKYKDALEKDDIAYMEQLLKEGSDLKDEIDK